jgi:hypothetical protein
MFEGPDDTQENRNSISFFIQKNVRIYGCIDFFPARQPQPRRCVLTMHEVQSIKDLVFVVGGNSESSAQKAIFEIISDGIRKATATHTSPPEPSTVVEDITFEGAAIVQSARKDAAKAARETVLRELTQRLDENIGSMEDCVVEMKIETFREVIGIVESLRAQRQGGVSE